MTRSKTIGLSLLGWLVIGLFWLIATRDFHPTWALAIVVTTTLMVAYATVAYIHHHHLIPTYWQAGLVNMHLVWLACTMLVLTGIALAIIRVSYSYVFGPYPVGPWYVNFVLDLFGMAVHLVLAMVAVKLFKRFSH